jgi:putative transposase
VKERESSIAEGHICPDHAHTLIEIPLKYLAAQMVGYIRGKSAIAIGRRFEKMQKSSPTKLLGERVV